MAYENCIIKLEEFLGKPLNKQDKTLLKKTVDNLVNRADPSMQGDDLLKVVSQKLEALAADIQTAAKIKKRNTLLNQKAYNNLTSVRLSHWKDEPSEWFKTIFETSNINRVGSKHSLSVTTRAKVNHFTMGIVSELAEKGRIKDASTGLFDDDAFLAVIEMNHGRDVSGFKEESVDIAKLIKKYNDFTRKEANLAGAFIGEDPMYVVSRNYDQAKVARFAGKDVPKNSPEHAKAFKSFLMDNMDRDKSFPNLPVEDFGKAIDSLFVQFSNGYHLSFKDSNIPVGLENIGKRVSHAREIVFKTPQAELEFYKRIRAGNNLIEDVLSNYSSLGRDVAIMEKLGPNATITIDKLFNETMNDLTAEGRGAEAVKLQKEYKSQMRKNWPQITGEVNIPENATLAVAGQAIRNNLAMGSLGASILSQVGDIPVFGASQRFYGDRSLWDMFKGMGEVIKGTIGEIGVKTRADEMKVLAEAGVGLQVMTFPMDGIGAELQTGSMSKLIQHYFKLNLQTPWVNKVKKAATLMHLSRHYEHSGMEFDALPVGMIDTFRHMGGDKAEWNVIRAVEPVAMGDHTILTVEGIRDLSDDVFRKEYPGLSDYQLGAKRREVETFYRNYISEAALLASSEPLATDRANIVQGTSRGTWSGEFLRTAGILKSFTLNLMKNHIGREMFGYHSQNSSIPKALQRMITDPGGGSLAGLSNLMVFSTLAGYASLQLKQLSKGKETRPITDAKSFGKVLMASAAQGGALGIYGDFLFAETNRFGGGWTETLLGPGARAFTDIGKVYGAIVRGEDASSEAFNFGTRYVPGVNAAYSLFYSKLLLDYAFFYKLKENMNPGYLRRMEKRLKTEHNQEFIVPPSSVVPYGG